MKLFIDANIYLDFYEIQAVKPLLKPLIEVSEHVLVTRQVIDEVYRRKLDIANKRFNEYLSKINTSLALPDVLTENAVAQIDEKAINKLKEFSYSLKECKELLEDIYGVTLEQISKNEDNVSTELMKLFNNALTCTKEQIASAQIRKCFGNPPGKIGDPVGDEINWEQMLDYAKENACPIWVVSRDGDYMSKVFNKRTLGNPFLLREIHERGLTDFRFFDNLSAALQEIKKEINKDLELPSEAELAVATQAQERRQTLHDRSKCTHEMEVVIRDGAYDIWQCRRCGTQYRQYSMDICDS